MEIKTMFEEIYGYAPERIFCAAGRVNLIGEHVDYCGGKVLPAALSLKCRVAVRRNGTNFLRLAATDLAGVVTVDLARTGEYRSLKWGNYQAGVAHEMKGAGYRLVGCDLLYDCTVPFGAGLSSSAAIEVATAYALASMGGNAIDKTALALLSKRAENEYCGVNCGIMDQFAAANGVRGHAMLLDCATLACEQVPLDLKDCALVLADSRKPHTLAQSKYNERRAETEEALALLKQKLSVERLAQVTRGELEAHRGLLSPVLYRRARHVVTECERVERSVLALKAGDLITFGRLLNASHASLKEDYEVTGAELDALAAAAMAREECLGTRMTGAGFGGCTVNLVKKDKISAFIEAVGRIYTEKTGLKAAFYVAETADGISEEAYDA